MKNLLVLKYVYISKYISFNYMSYIKSLVNNIIFELF